MKPGNTKFVMRCVLAWIVASAISACSDDYRKVEFTTDKILSSGTIIIADGSKLNDVHLIPNQSLITNFEVKKLGDIEVKDVWIEVELSPVNKKSRTSLTATTLYFDKDKKSSLSIKAFGYDVSQKEGVHADCKGVCTISDNPIISFATMKDTDLGGYSALVRKTEK